MRPAANGTNAERTLSPHSGTADTDNLSAIMRNNVVVFESPSRMIKVEVIRLPETAEKDKE